jgi:RNA polymerase sigma factor (sigma-70 family)
MDQRSDQELLRQYAKSDDEAAFTELVRRHVDFLFSAALRMAGERHLAEDVTQCVFVLLARNAAALAEHPVLSGWLHQTTRNVASKMVRTEVRRRTREQEAAMMMESDQRDESWDTIASSLDAALEDIKGEGRDALFLRYFERKSANEIATVLGITEAAAQKRVNRAVERLREIFLARGVTISATGLAAALAASSVQAAPTALAASISAAVFNGSVITASVSTTAKVIVMTTVQKVVIATALVLTAATAVFEGVRAKNFEQEAGFAHAHGQILSNEVRQITEERDEAINRLSAVKQTSTTSKSDEISRLRAQIANLRGQVNKQNVATNPNDAVLAAAKVLADRVTLLRDRFDRWTGKQTPELQLLSDQDWFEEALKQPLETDEASRAAMGELRTRAKNRLAEVVQDALENFAKANNDQLPTDLSQLAPFLNPSAAACLGGYEIAPPGSVKPPQPNSPNAERAEKWAMVEKGSLGADGIRATDGNTLSDPEYDMYVVIYRGGHYGYGGPDFKAR